jgi:hypothetical protein
MPICNGISSNMPRLNSSKAEVMKAPDSEQDTGQNNGPLL